MAEGLGTMHTQGPVAAHEAVYNNQTQLSRTSTSQHPICMLQWQPRQRTTANHTPQTLRPGGWQVALQLSCCSLVPEQQVTSSCCWLFLLCMAAAIGTAPHPYQCAKAMLPARLSRSSSTRPMRTYPHGFLYCSSADHGVWVGIGSAQPLGVCRWRGDAYTALTVTHAQHPIHSACQHASVPVHRPMRLTHQLHQCAVGCEVIGDLSDLCRFAAAAFGTAVAAAAALGTAAAAAALLLRLLLLFPA